MREKLREQEQNKGRGVIRSILSRLDGAGKRSKRVQPDSPIIFTFTPDCIDGRRLQY
jgi:hypothetical protein